MAAVLQATPQRYPAPTVRTEVRSVWSAQALRGCGALWSDREAALYWVDTAGRQLHRFDPTRKLRDSWSFSEDIGAVVECGERPGLLVALRHELAIFEPETGRLQHLHRTEPAHPGNRLGAARCDAQGRLWVGTHNPTTPAATSTLYRYTGASQCTSLLRGGGTSHGLTWSHDQRTLFLADPAQGRVSACDFDANSGTLGPARPWLQLARQDGSPQGLCTDAAGRIWLARTGAGSVSCHAPDTGEELLRIRVPSSQVTGCTFGGRELRTLFITSACQHTPDAAHFSEPLAGALFAVDMDSPGTPAHAFAG